MTTPADLDPDALSDVVPDVTVRVDRLVVETDLPVDAFGLQRALPAALEAAIAQRGLPEAWRHDLHSPVVVLEADPWAGTGGMAGLAQHVVACLYGLHGPSATSGARPDRADDPKDGTP